MNPEDLGVAIQIDSRARESLAARFARRTAKEFEALAARPVDESGGGWYEVQIQ